MFQFTLSTDMVYICYAFVEASCCDMINCVGPSFDSLCLKTDAELMN